MSKKNISKSSSKPKKKESPKKKVSKKIKVIEEEFDSDDLEGFYSSIEIDLNEMEEKNNIEKIIKGDNEIKKPNKEKIDETVAENENEQSKKVKSITKEIKKPNKQSKVDAILKLYDQLEIPEADRLVPAALKNTPMSILEQKLGALTEKATKQIAKVDPLPDNTKGTISDDLAVSALFNVNIIMSQFVENLADIGRQNDMTKDYVPNLNGLTKRFLKPDKEKQLRECLKGIVAEHGESIKPYLSASSIYLMFLISTGAEQVSENMSKNLSEAITTTAD
jgi:hypothetical protein